MGNLPVCNGTRFNSKVLGVKTGGLNIAEVLELTVHEAINFFGNHRKLKSGFELLAELGLGHLKLGHPPPLFQEGSAMFKNDSRTDKTRFGEMPLPA